MYFVNFCFRGELGFPNCDDICMCIVNKQFDLLKFVFDSVYVDMQYDEISLTFTTGSLCSMMRFISLFLLGLCACVVVFGLFVRLSWYPMWMRWLM